MTSEVPTKNETQQVSGGLLEMLKELEAAGRITADQHEHFAYKVRALAQSVEAFHGSEERLAAAESHLRKKLEEQRNGLKRLTDLQLEDAGTVVGMNKDVTRGESDIGNARDSESAAVAEAEQLEAERNRLRDELDQQRQQQETVVAPRLQALRKVNDELSESIEREKELLAQMAKEKEAVRNMLERGAQDQQNTRVELEQASKDVAKARAKPDHVRHQIEQLELSCETILGDIARTEEQIRVSEADEREARRVVQGKEEELRQQATQLDTLRTEIDQRERMCERAMRDLEAEKAKGMDLHTVRNGLEMRDKHAVIEQRHAEDRLASRKREFAKHLKQLQRTQEMAEGSKRAIPDLERTRSERKRELDAAQSAQKEQRIQLEHERMELDVLISALLAEHDLQTNVREDLEKTRKDIAQSQETLAHLEEQEEQLKKTLSDIAVEREQKAHEAAASRARVKEVNKRLRSCDTEIIELQRHLADSQSMCSDYLEVFERVKGERKKYLDVINRCALIRSEYTDKMKIAQSELEILQEETRSRDKLLQQEEQEFNRTRQQKDEMRAEVNKQVYARQQGEEHTRHLSSTIEKIQTQIKLAEHEIVVLKRRYEAFVDSRNTVATQVVNRNQQLVLLHGQRNSQQSETEREEMELKCKEEERQMLEVVLADSRRDVEAISRIVQHGIPAQVREIESLKEQLRKERARSIELAAKLETPQGTDRWSVLSGLDPSNDELAQKLDLMERRSEELDAKLKQKEVLLEELEKRTRELLEKRDVSRAEVTESLAKLNEVRTKVVRLDAKIMATLAELSLYRAQAIQLEQAAKDMEAMIKEANERMIEGKAPTIDAEREWYNMELRRQLKMKELKEQQQQQILNMTSWGERTAAPKRFATYVPDDGLGLPRAYGAHPPFRPTSSSAAARLFKHQTLPLSPPSTTENK